MATTQPEMQSLLTAATPGLLKVDEVARALRCSRHSVYRRVADGSLPAMRIGARGPLRVRVYDLERLLQPARTEETSA